MATVTDIIERARAVTTADGDVITRGFVVDGLTGAPDYIAYSAKFAPGIPSYGDPHPSIPVVKVSNITAKALGTGIAEIEVTYQNLSPESEVPDDSSKPLISIGGTTQFVRKTVDSAGNDITVTHTFVDTDADGNTTLDTRSQFVEVDVQQSLASYRFTRREAEAPNKKSIAYRDRINRTTFLGEPAKTMICSRLDGDSSDGGESYTVSYEFVRNPDTWDAVVTYIGEDGRPPENLVQGEGRRTVQIYELADFTALNLSL